MSSLLESSAGLRAAYAPNNPGTVSTVDGADSAPACLPLVVTAFAVRTRGFTFEAGQRRGWCWKSAISVIASVLLHSGALLAALYIGWNPSAHWRLYETQGRNSVELQASIAATAAPRPRAVEVVKPSAFETAEAVLKPAEPIPLAEQERLRNKKLPQRLVDDAMQQAIASVQPSAVQEIRRAEAEAAPQVPTPERSAPPKSSAEAMVTPDQIAVDFDSLASPGSMASSGSEQPAPPDAVQLVFHYPRESQATGEVGIVRVAVRVDRLGNVVHAELHESSGFARLDAAAVDGLRRGKFAPYDPADARATQFVWPVTFVRKGEGT